MRIPSGSTDRYVFFVAVDSGDLKTRETGLTTFTVYYSLNGGTATAMTTPTVNETSAANMPGVYELLIDESGMTTLTAGNDTEELCLHITQASMAPVTRVVEIYRPETTEGNTLDVTATGAAGVDWGNVENQGTSVDLSATSINLTDTATSVTNGVTVTTNNDKTGYSLAADQSGVTVGTVNSVAAGGITATSIATDAVDADALSADAIAEINATVDTALSDIGLQYLVNTALPTNWATDVTANSALDYMADDGTAGYDRTTDSLQAVRDWVGDGTSLTEAGGTGDHLTAIDLPNQTMDITGNLSGSVGSVTGAVGSVTGNVGGNVTGSVGSLGTTAKSDVNAEVADVLKTDTISELTQAVPSATPTFEDAIMLLYMALRNKVDITSSWKEVHNDAGTVICKKALTDDGTTYSEAEMQTGP